MAVPAPPDTKRGLAACFFVQAPMAPIYIRLALPASIGSSKTLNMASERPFLLRFFDISVISISVSGPY